MEKIKNVEERKKFEIVVYDHWKLEEEELEGILDEFFQEYGVNSLEEELTIFYKYKERVDTLIVNAMNYEEYFDIVKRSSDKADAFEKIVSVFAEEIMEHNFHYLFTKTLKGEDITYVHCHAYENFKNSLSKNLIAEAGYLRRFFENINENIEIIEEAKKENIVEIDRKLREKKRIEDDYDRFIVFQTFKEVESDDMEGRNWIQHGRDKFGRRMISYETREWRGLSISEFYGGGVVD